MHLTIIQPVSDFCHYSAISFLVFTARCYRRARLCRQSVCLSVRNNQVLCSNTLEFFENNLTAE